MEIGTACVAAITMICYLVGLVVKASPWDNSRYIPIVCAGAGGLLGLAALRLGMSGFPASDPLTALAVGIASGLAATGADQMGKQMTKNE